MEDDLNTADAIAALFELVRDINVRCDPAKTPAKADCQAAKALFEELTEVLGFLYERQDGLLDEEIEALIAAVPRRAARKTGRRPTASGTS